jgi:hypothetical protein
MALQANGSHLPVSFGLFAPLKSQNIAVCRPHFDKSQCWLLGLGLDSN